MTRPANNILVALTLIAMALLVACTAKGPTYVDDKADYTLKSVEQVMRRTDSSAYDKRLVSDAPTLRHDALVALRSQGDGAASAADLITRTFPLDTRSVPVRIERATVNGVAALVVVEATGPKSGNLRSKRLWVIDESGNVLFASTGE